ncbi:RNA polymerase sigma factor [Herbaspirillum sp. HC18]|nr:RNA polymerase sigma factor [Herbaspirillum sp. HC18]
MPYAVLAPENAAHTIRATHATIPRSSDQSVPAIDLNQLFRRHHNHLLRFVQRYVRNAEDAKDVVQSTFLEAVRCKDRFSGSSKPSTWLFGIAHNLARNQVRRNCADKFEEFDETIIDQLIDDHADPVTLLEQREIAGRVEHLLNGLQSNIRATFEAVLEGESTYEEAAEKLKIPVGTVRSRISRVRAAVRSHCA